MTNNYCRLLVLQTLYKVALEESNLQVKLLGLKYIREKLKETPEISIFRMDILDKQIKDTSKKLVSKT